MPQALWGCGQGGLGRSWCHHHSRTHYWDSVLPWVGGRNKGNPLQGENKRVFGCLSTDLNATGCRFACRHAVSAKEEKKKKEALKESKLILVFTPCNDFLHQKIHFCFPFKVSCLLMKMHLFFSLVFEQQQHSKKNNKKGRFLTFFKCFWF